jgi:hypothetical protein
MSSFDGKPADLSDRERFPVLRERYGYDPARFLDQPLLESGERSTAESGQMLARAVIDGIDHLEKYRAWIAVERRIERGPREAVLEWIEEREAWLEEHGDREERLDYEAIPDREERVEPRSAEEYEAMPVRTPQPDSYRLWGSPSERLAEKARRREQEETDADADAETESEAEGTPVPSWEELGDQLDPVAAADGGDPEVDP